MTRTTPLAESAQFRLPILAFALACLLHFDHSPPWCLALALGASAWRLLPGGASRRLPSRTLRLAITAALVAVLVATSRFAGGLSFGTALLMAMGAAKIAETRERRDGYTLTVVALFLLLAAILDRQDLARVPFYALVAWVGCAALAALGGRRDAESPRVALVTAGRALAWALPIAIFAFLFFPRVQGGLWGMPGSGRAQTGLSDEMSPGSISELSISDAVAFRVVFRRRAAGSRSFATGEGRCCIRSTATRGAAPRARRPPNRWNAAGHPIPTGSRSSPMGTRGGTRSTPSTPRRRAGSS